MNQQVTLTYRLKSAKIGYLLSILLFPIWGLAAPVGAVIALATAVACWQEWGSTLYRTSAFIHLSDAFCSSLLFFGGTALSGIAKESKILMDSDGIELPFILCGQNKGQRFVLWQEMKQVSVIKDNADRDHLVVLTTDGKFDIDLTVLNKHDREQLILSMALLTAEGNVDQSLLQTRDKLALELSETPSLLSFTNLWEEELASRFSTTAYLPLTPGDSLAGGRFKIIRQLNLGGWSAVYLASESDVRSRVIKESVMPVDADVKLRAKALEMFERENLLLLKIDHDAIVKAYEYFVDNDRHYIVLNYVPGENLRKMLQIKGPQHELNVLHWALGLADILLYLHGLKPPLIHRDLTPDNIIATSSGELKLIDFGAANEFIGTATGTMVGKQSYMAPEQFKGKATVQSDLYSLGATLYFLLTAKDPLPMQRASVIRDCPAIQINPELDRLIGDLTEPDQALRIESAEGLLDRLKAIVN